MTKITDIKPIDFNDKMAIIKEINNFFVKYAYADIEYAHIISPDGNMYSLIGTKYEVNSEIIGKHALNGSIVIHNHPVESGKNKGDSFSIKDLKFAAENNLGKQYLVSGKRRDAFEFTKSYTTDEISVAWRKSTYSMWEKHENNGTIVVFEQADILKEVHKYLKGFIYYENIRKRI